MTDYFQQVVYALAYISLPLDGKDTYQTILEMTRKVDQRDTERFEKEVEALEERTDIKVVDGLVAAIKGESAVWCVRPPGATPSPYPEIGAVIETRDEASAGLLASGTQTESFTQSSPRRQVSPAHFSWLPPSPSPSPAS